jgi:hypothetical protein
MIEEFAFQPKRKLKLKYRRRAEGIEAIILSPMPGDFNEDSPLCWLMLYLPRWGEAGPLFGEATA